ncbi:MAG: hypothetical protein ACRYGR_06550 [Janthinobacterium lividum]
MNKSSKLYQILLLSSMLISINNKGYSSYQSAELLENVDQSSPNFNQNASLRTITTQEEQLLYKHIFEEKELFWRPVLNHNEALRALINLKIGGHEVSNNEIFHLIFVEIQKSDYIWENSNNPSNLQEKIFKFFNLPSNQSFLSKLPEDFQKLYHPQNLLDMGITQNRAWAFLKKAELIIERNIEEDKQQNANKQQLFLQHKLERQVQSERARQYFVSAANVGDRNALKILESYFPQSYKFYNKKGKVISKQINKFIKDSNIYPHQLYNTL